MEQKFGLQYPDQLSNWIPPIMDQSRATWHKDPASLMECSFQKCISWATRKHHTWPLWGTFYRITGLYSSKIFRSWMSGDAVDCARSHKSRQHVRVARDKLFHSLGRYWETRLNVKGVWRLEGSKGSVLISWFQWSPCGYVEFCIWRKLTKVLEGTRPATYAQREKVCMFNLQLFLILLLFQNKELF